MAFAEESTRLTDNVALQAQQLSNNRIRRKGFESLTKAYQKKVVIPGWPPANAHTGSEGEVTLDGENVGLSCK